MVDGSAPTITPARPIGLVRVGAIFATPTDNTLQRWDSNGSYSAT